MTTTRLYLARHGETIWNAEGRIQGDADIELSEKGCRQAQALMNKLSSVPIHSIYTSHLHRTIETARPIADLLGLELHIDKRLKELHFGVLEGQLLAHFTEDEKNIWKSFWDDPTATTIPQGEQYLDLYARVVSSCDEILSKYSGRNILIVTHKQVNRVILAYLTGFPLKNVDGIAQNNDQMYRVDVVSSGFCSVMWTGYGGPPDSWQVLALPF